MSKERVEKVHIHKEVSFIHKETYKRDLFILSNTSRSNVNYCKFQDTVPNRYTQSKRDENTHNETYKRDLFILSNTFTSHLNHCMFHDTVSNRPIHAKRDEHIRKETYERELFILSNTSTSNVNHCMLQDTIETDLYTRKETYTNTKRPIKETSLFYRTRPHQIFIMKIWHVSRHSSK